MPDFLCTVDDLLEEDFHHQWLLEHLLPTGAGLLFHGKRGCGKSLLAVALAIAVLNEARFFSSWQTRKRGSVLYVQADLPPVMQQERIQRIMGQLPWVREQDLYFYFPETLDVTRLDEDDELTGALQETDPGLVIWDVLRKIHRMREEVHVPAQVYGSTQYLFPDSGHMYLHHDKKWTKDRAEGYLDPSEDFSGVGPWLDLVVSGWHLEEESKGKYSLSTTKNNCGPETNKILLRRDPDTLLPVLRLPKIQEEIRYWRAAHECNPRGLRRSEREKLRRYLLSSFVGAAMTVERMVEEA